MLFNCYEDGDLNLGETRFYEVASKQKIVGEHLWQGESHRGLHVNEFSRDEIINERAIKITQKQVFISHRQSDSQEALRFANHLRSNGISFWLDIADPRLTSGRNLHPIAIANIIEMALINSTHVVALITANSAGSLWIPYEYGRIKEPKANAGNVCAYNQLPVGSRLPEYMQLGATTTRDIDTVSWINATPI